MKRAPRALRARLVETLGAKGVARLGRSTVAVIGLGQLGGRMSHELTLLGVGQLLVDPGRVEAANATQGLPPVAAGEPKGRIRAWQARLLDPCSRVEAIEAPLEELGTARLARVDLLVGGLDSRRSRLHLNALSQRLGIPWLDLALDGSGERLLGTVSLYQPGGRGAPCWGCRLDATALANLLREDRPAACPSWRVSHLPATRPTLTAPAFAGVVAGLAALWCVEALLGRTRDLAGRQLLVEGNPPRVRPLRLERSLSCIHHHARLHPLRPAPGETLGALLEGAAAELGRPPQSVELARPLVLGLLCAACGRESGRVRAVQALSDEELRCPGCASELGPLRLADRLTGADLHALAELRFDESGLPEQDVVSVRAGARAAHYIVNPADAGRDGDAKQESTR